MPYSDRVLLELCCDGCGLTKEYSAPVKKLTYICAKADGWFLNLARDCYCPHCVKQKEFLS
jgi:hypothetical protein